jgi:hypothetical protein
MLIPKDHRPAEQNRAEKKLIIYDDMPDLGRGPIARKVFSHFQNLNLRVLIEDLRRGQTVHGAWSSDSDLCPLSHGLSSGHTIGLLRYLSQSAGLKRACALAADDLGTTPRAVERFVIGWDSGGVAPEWLLLHLERLWAERVQDADVVQALIAPAGSAEREARSAQRRGERNH